MTPPQANADPARSAARDRRAAWMAGLLLALLAGFYVGRGMPWVYNDDLAFTGAGMDLARTGRLTNHTMDGWLPEFGTTMFYIQLPFGSYSLAGWICLFGASTASFLVFEWLCYALGGWGLVRLLGRFGLPLGVRLAAVAAYLTGALQFGLRPEAEAFGLMFAGLALLDTAAPSGRKLAALLLLGFAVLTYPMTLGVAAPFAVALLWLGRGPGAASGGEWMRDAWRAWRLPLVVAVGIVVLAFLVMIRFDLGEFLRVLNAHRRSRDLPEGNYVGFYRLLTEYNGWALNGPLLLALVAAVGFVVVRGREVEPALRALVAAWAAAVVLCVLLYAAAAPPWVLWFAFCAAVALSSAERFRRWRWLAVTLLAGAFAWSQVLWLITAALQRFPDPAVLRAARDAALRSGKALVIDASTLRHVFNYRLPPGARDVQFLKPRQRITPMTLADKKDGEYWIVSTAILDAQGNDLPRVYRDYPRITIGRHAFSSMPLRPDEPVVFP